MSPSGPHGASGNPEAGPRQSGGERSPAPANPSAGRPALRVLLIEPDAGLVDSTLRCLQSRWPSLLLVAVASGRDAIQVARRSPFDVLILELLLPDIYGMQVLKEVRGHIRAAVIVVTFEAGAASQRTAFALGAADFLVKPSTCHAVLSAVQAALGPTWQRRRMSPVETGGRSLMLDLVGNRILRGAAAYPLSAAERAVLLVLVRHAGSEVAFADLARAAGSQEPMRQSALSALLDSLRLKLGDDPRASARLVISQAGCTLALSAPQTP